MDLLGNKRIALTLCATIALFSCRTPDDSGSMQPIDGYPFLTDRKEIKQLLEEKCIDTINFIKGEVVADIGAGNGYIEAMLSLFHDSLTFYIQDIDTSVCNKNNIDDVVKFYEQVNGAPFTNKFIVINGTDSATNLPDNTFDKILMLYTYQYIREPRAFILDVRKKLKHNGLFYVINPQYDDYSGLELQRQQFGWNGSPLEKEISDIIDCGFELIRIDRNWNYEGYDNPYFMVFKRKN